MKRERIKGKLKGFKEGLAEEGYKEGDNLTIDYQKCPKQSRQPEKYE